MTQQFATVDANSNLETFVREHLLPTGHRCFVVLEVSATTGPYLVLAGFFLLAVAVSELMSNSGTVALLGPITVSAASEMVVVGRDNVWFVCRFCDANRLSNKSDDLWTWLLSFQGFYRGGHFPGI